MQQDAAGDATADAIVEEEENDDSSIDAMKVIEGAQRPGKRKASSQARAMNKRMNVESDEEEEDDVTGDEAAVTTTSAEANAGTLRTAADI